MSHDTLDIMQCARNTAFQRPAFGRADIDAATRHTVEALGWRQRLRSFVVLCAEGLRGAGP